MKTEVDLSVDEAIGLGIKMFSEDRKKEAEGIFRGTVAANPDSFTAQLWVGICAFESGNNYEALYRFERALKIDRKNPVARANRGMILSELGHLDEAEAELRLAAHHDPKAHIAVVNLANVLVRAGRFKEGILVATKAIDMDPKDDIGYFNRGIALYSLDRVDHAIDDFDRALAANPQNAEATYNRALALLKVGRLKEGFRDYDARLHTTEVGSHYFKPTAPWWKGEDLAGKTLLVHGEQGIGDSIQFMRYVDVIVDKFPTAKIVLVTHTALLSMCQRHGYRYVTVHPAADKAYPEHDFYTYLMSIPGIVGTDIDSIPPAWEPYCGVNCDRCRLWADIAPRGREMNIGICWSGNAIHRNDAHRSIPFEQFSPILFSNGSYRFHCLQREIRRTDRAHLDLLGRNFSLGVKTHCEYLTDMRETSHLIQRMDLVISVDTSVAHLAATMDVPTWILLPKFRTDWRWGMNGDKTPWYPNATLFRQPAVGDWDSVVKAVSGALEGRQKAAA